MKEKNYSISLGISDVTENEEKKIVTCNLIGVWAHGDLVVRKDTRPVI